MPQWARNHAPISLLLTLFSPPLCTSLQRNGQLETQFKSSAYAKCHVISITQHGKRIEERVSEWERAGNLKRGKNKKENSRSVYKLSQERGVWPQCGRHSACCMSIMSALVASLSRSFSLILSLTLFRPHSAAEQLSVCAASLLTLNNNRDAA